MCPYARASTRKRPERELATGAAIVHLRVRPQGQDEACYLVEYLAVVFTSTSSIQ